MLRRFKATLLLGHVLENLGSLCLCRSSAEFILTQSRLSSNHRCRSAITTSVGFLCVETEKCSRVSSCVRRTGSRAVLLSAHQEKRFVISSSSETSRVALCWNPRTQRSVAHLHLPKTSDEGVCEPAAVCACGVSAFHSHEHGRLMFCICVAGRRT